jgi:hypothetical protein
MYGLKPVPFKAKARAKATARATTNAKDAKENAEVAEGMW